MDNVLDNYVAAQDALFRYFGYVEDWKAIPIDDRRACYWMLQQDADGRGTVTYLDSPMGVDEVRSGSCCTDTIYTQRFLPRWVYRAPDLTMVCVDTHTDGNKFLAIFDNSREVAPTPELVEANEHWRKLFA